MMKPIETEVEVDPSHNLTVKVPAEVPPGTYRAVLVLEPVETPKQAVPFGLKPYDIGLVDPNFTFRREDLYGDGDR